MELQKSPQLLILRECSIFTEMNEAIILLLKHSKTMISAYVTFHAKIVTVNAIMNLTFLKSSVKLPDSSRQHVVYLNVSLDDVVVLESSFEQTLHTKYVSFSKNVF